MLHKAEGATLAEIMKVTGWQSHSVRGFVTFIIDKKASASGVALSAVAQARVAGERPNQRWSRLDPKSAFSPTSASDAP